MSSVLNQEPSLWETIFWKHNCTKRFELLSHGLHSDNTPRGLQGQWLWFLALFRLPLFILSATLIVLFFFNLYIVQYFGKYQSYILSWSHMVQCCPLALDGQVMPNLSCLTSIFFSPFLADRERLIRVGVPLSYFWGRSLLGNKLQNCIFEMHRSISVVWWFGNEALIIRLNSKRKLFLLVVPCQVDRFIECTYFSGEH